MPPGLICRRAWEMMYYPLARSMELLTVLDHFPQRIPDQKRLLVLHRHALSKNDRPPIRFDETYPRTDQGERHTLPFENFIPLPSLRHLEIAELTIQHCRRHIASAFNGVGLCFTSREVSQGLLSMRMALRDRGHCDRLLVEQRWN